MAKSLKSIARTCIQISKEAHVGLARLRLVYGVSHTRLIDAAVSHLTEMEPAAIGELLQSTGDGTATKYRKPVARKSRPQSSVKN
jgi:hypothetical protein